MCEGVIMCMEIESTIEKIEKSKEPLEVLGKLIMESGGFWNPTEATDPTKLFNIHLCGIHGIGIGATAALDDWIDKAKETVKWLNNV